MMIQTLVKVHGLKLVQVFKTVHIFVKILIQKLDFQEDIILKLKTMKFGKLHLIDLI